MTENPSTQLARPCTGVGLDTEPDGRGYHSAAFPESYEQHVGSGVYGTADYSAVDLVNTFGLAERNPHGGYDIAILNLDVVGRARGSTYQSDCTTTMATVHLSPAHAKAIRDGLDDALAAFETHHAREDGDNRHPPDGHSASPNAADQQEGRE